MASELIFVVITTIVFLAISSLFLHCLMRSQSSELEMNTTLPEPSVLAKKLVAALPDIIILPQDMEAFKNGLNAYWAQQECEVIPACIVRPRTVQELSTAVGLFKREHDEREKLQDVDGKNSVGVFAIRGGGHSPIPGAASIQGGAVVDLRYVNSVTISEDEKSVVVGGGAKWIDVSKALDERGLAVSGGRNAAVGVGGFTLGGGISFFTPRFGLACSNVISYEVVLADGSITTASSTENHDLWKALKGSSNNFGIVTSFTFKSFPCSKIWSGFLYYPAFQATKILKAFHETIKKMDNDNFKHGAGPLTSFSYIPKINLQLLAVNLASTELAENPKKWPACWKATPFSSLWRYWSTCKVRTLTNATNEMNALNPPGRRQTFGSITIKNDPATISAAHRAYHEAFESLRAANPKGMLWTIVLQPFLASWARKGDENPLGLHNTTETLIVVSFTVNWDKQVDDDFVKQTTRLTLEKIEAFASSNNTNHKFQYLNYCNEWQKPFESYGEDNWQFLKEVSKKYDPDGLFQRGCLGGFKLEIDKNT